MSSAAIITPLEAWIAAKIGREGQPLTLEALQSYQLSKLNETLALAQSKSAFYRETLGGKNISLSHLEQLADLPLTSPEQVRSAPLGFLCVRQDEVERIVTLPTSGTTGAPKRIFFSRADQDLTRDFFHRGMSTLVDPGHRVLILLPGQLPGSVGDLLKDGLARMDVEGIPHGPVTDPRRTLQVIEEERVTALVGIPIQVLRLARLADGKRRIGLKSVLLSTDRVPEVVEKTLEETWGCTVFNHYGTTEMGLGGGVDCRALAGYHLREADLFFEVVDPTSGRPVPEGESGEVVFTTLTREAMPLIRYRTGDVSRFVPGPCPCGTVLRRLAHVHERLDGSLTLAGGGILRQRDLDEALLALPQVADFQVSFSRSDTGYHLEVRVRGHDNSPGPPEAEIVRALFTIPALRSETDGGGISVAVRAWEPVDGSRQTGTAKRKIEYLQGAM